jgi:hypothetical protein
VKSFLLSAAVLSGMLAPALFPSYSKAQRSADSFKTFTAPDGTFSFRYSSELTDCSSKPGQVLPENCMAYFPMCSREDQDVRVITCFAYPRNKYTNTGAFEAAMFSVNVSEVETEKECVEPSDQDHKPRKTAASTHGVSFSVFEGAEGRMSQSHTWRVYSAFHNGKCYHLALDWAMANSQAFDPPAKQITKEGWADIERRLEEPRRSFRFLK